MRVHSYTKYSLALCGDGAPLFPLVHLLSHLFPLFYFSLSFIGFTSEPGFSLFCSLICVICIP